MLEAYKNKYIAEINQWRGGNSQVPVHQMYERLWAIEKGQILWTDIPPGFEDIYDLPHRNDYGIDLIDLQYSGTSQVKFYGETSFIKWSDITNYTSYSKDILGIQKLNLLTTPVAKIDKMVQRLFANNPEFIQRMTLDALLEKIPIEVIFEDEVKCSQIEERSYLLSTANSIIEMSKPFIKVQWPCGTGKTYLALYLFTKIQETLKKGEIFLFITPWRSLGRQILQECVFLGINAGMIGDGKRVLEKSWKFVICLTASMHILPKDLKVSYKFGDEGHHFEKEGAQATEFNNIIATKTILMSATFHMTQEIDYIMTKREAIDAGIITDYKIHLQYYTGGRSDAILKMVKENSDWIPMFIYFNTTEKAKNFSKLLRENHISVDYLTGEDGEDKRARIKEQITNGLLVVVCLCGVWNEGESIHILRTVIFGDLRHSSINIRQVAQRGSRKHPSKPFYNIVLPIENVERGDDSEDDSDSESGEDDMTYLQKIIKIFSDEDPIIKKSIQNKSYTRFNIRMNNEIIKETGNETEESTLLYMKVFNSLGEMVEGKRETTKKWFENLERVKLYIRKNKKRPTSKSKNKQNSRLGFWIGTQIKNSNPEDRKQIMKNDTIFKLWVDFTSSQEFNYYFSSREERWKLDLENVKQFIRTFKRLPKSRGEDKTEKRLGIWIYHQIGELRSSDEKNGSTVRNSDIFKLWVDFTSSEEFKNYFLDNDFQWKKDLENVKQFIRKTNRRPSDSSNDGKYDAEERRLGRWIGTQIKDSKATNRLYIMKKDEIFKLWTDFISDDEFNIHFLDPEDLWKASLEDVKNFIRTKKYRPSSTSKQSKNNEEERKLGKWLGAQISNSKSIPRDRIMAKDHIFEIWKEFVSSQEFRNYFAENKWKTSLEEVKNFIRTKNHRPIKRSKDKLEKSFGVWLSTQLQNSNPSNRKQRMKEDDIFQLWKEFIMSPDFCQYFPLQQSLYANAYTDTSLDDTNCV